MPNPIAAHLPDRNLPSPGSVSAAAAVGHVLQAGPTPLQAAGDFRLVLE